MSADTVTIRPACVVSRVAAIGVMMVCATTVADLAQVRVVRRGEDRLTGISTVDVLVLARDAATPCATPVQPLQQIAVSALRGAAIRASVSEKASSWFHTLTVETRSVVHGSRCATSVSSDLATEVEAIPQADGFSPPGAWGSWLIGQLSLVREAGLVSADARAHGQQVQAMVRAQVTAIAERIRAANKDR